METPLVKYFILAFKKFADFNGRANKREFWWYFLASIIVSIVLGLISPNLSNLYALISLIPGLAIGARRLHDIGKGGWMQLVLLIPVIGIIWLIVLWAQDGDPKKNKYGEPSRA